MEVVRELMRKPRHTDSLAIGLFVIAVLYTVYRGTAHTILMGIGFTLIVLGALPHQVALAFLVGASAILLVQRRQRIEGFDGSTTADSSSAEPTVVEDPTANALAEHEKEEDMEAEAEKKKEKAENAEAEDEILHGTKSEGFSDNSKKPMLPDNADRKEMLELGKPYKLPSESDDKGFHMDAGTTFLNAYKALKPDQIAAMTKDTQELLATQKSLIGMLDSFGPLMKDMGKITGFFGPGGLPGQ
jgi:hypothetical protein